MKVAIGCDHNGVALKKAIGEMLRQRGLEVQDMGCLGETPVDYPDIARQVAQAVAAGRCQQGILVCGTGIGMSMTANKVPGVRAAVCHDVFSARRARQHNDANVLCLGGLVIGVGPALEVVRAYLEAGFEGRDPGGERHLRRVRKIEALERECAGQ
jgi:ribose 5-phosphate isomerase B